MSLHHYPIQGRESWGVAYDRPHRHAAVVVCIGLEKESARAEAERLNREQEAAKVLAYADQKLRGVRFFETDHRL